jgi:hypothetical protein
MHVTICHGLQGKPSTLHAYKNRPEMPFFTHNQKLAGKTLRKFGLVSHGFRPRGARDRSRHEVPLHGRKAISAITS